MRTGKERKLKETIFEILKTPKPGDLLMDVPKVRSCRELLSFADDKEFWKSRVMSMRQQSVVHVELGKHVVEGSWAPFTVRS